MESTSLFCGDDLLRASIRRNAVASRPAVGHSLLVAGVSTARLGARSSPAAPRSAFALHVQPPVSASRGGRC